MSPNGNGDVPDFTHGLTQAMLGEHGHRRENDEESEKEAYTSAVCSVDFHAPLSQEARNEKVKQICKKHVSLCAIHCLDGALANGYVACTGTNSPGPGPAV
jgi:hypothetical protein